VFEVFQRELAPFMSMAPRREDYTPHWDAVMRIREELEASLEEEPAITKER